MWVDPNLNDFYSRVARIEKSHAKGYGFEAAGTVGRKAAGRGGNRLLKLVKPVLLVLAMGVGIKGVIHYFVGAQTYENRVSALAAGDGFDPVGAWLMHADPVTLMVSSQLQSLLPR
ncbi:MAG: hypothetical protein ACK4FR_05365 [Tabrizicola sp.]